MLVFNMLVLCYMWISNIWTSYHSTSLHLYWSYQINLVSSGSYFTSFAFTIIFILCFMSFHVN